MTKLEDISYYLHIPPPDPETDYFGDNYVEWHIYGWRRDGTSGLSRNDTSFFKFKMDSDQVSEFLKEWDDLKWEVYSLLLKNKESLRENTSEEVESGLPVLAWRLTEGIEGLPSFSRQEFDADVVWDFFSYGRDGWYWHMMDWGYGEWLVIAHEPKFLMGLLLTDDVAEELEDLLMKWFEKTKVRFRMPRRDVKFDNPVIHTKYSY